MKKLTIFVFNSIVFTSYSRFTNEKQNALITVVVDFLCVYQEFIRYHIIKKYDFTYYLVYHATVHSIIHPSRNRNEVIDKWRIALGRSQRTDKSMAQWAASVWHWCNIFHWIRLFDFFEIRATTAVLLHLSCTFLLPHL